MDFIFKVFLLVTDLQQGFANAFSIRAPCNLEIMPEKCIINVKPLA